MMRIQYMLTLILSIILMACQHHNEDKAGTSDHENHKPSEQFNTVTDSLSKSAQKLKSIGQQLLEETENEIREKRDKETISEE